MTRQLLEFEEIELGNRAAESLEQQQATVVAARRLGRVALQEQ